MPDNLVLERDVQYGQAGSRPLLLDIIRPKEPGERPLPVIVFIHGGGWAGKDKSHGIGRLLGMAARGEYFCVTIGYRLSGEAIWPAQIHDCKAAIRWLRANAKKYNLDPARIGAWGTSAGVHLASMLGTSGGVCELEGDCGSPGYCSRVTCVVNSCGRSDLAAIVRDKSSIGYSLVSKLLGGTIAAKEDAARSASPVTYATKDDPPFLIIHGTQDPDVPLQQSETLDAALKKAGVDSTLVKVEGGGHVPGGPEVHHRVVAFFGKHLCGRDVEVSGEPVQLGPRAKGK
jgi:acetyl esterase/lipase